tara:strand:- start:1461 stop:2267 length:807 start_codon:yes stop_codon:yes gene_type:complete
MPITLDSDDLTATQTSLGLTKGVANGNVIAADATGIPAINGSQVTALNATNLATGTVATARLGTGTASSSNFLRGDGSWQAAGGGSWELLHVTEVSSPVATVDIGAVGNTPFDDGFEIYCVTIDGFVASTGNTNLQCIAGFDSSGSIAYFTSDYFQHLQRTQSNHNGYLNTQGATTHIELGNNLENSTRFASQFVMYWSGMGPTTQTHNTIMHGNYCVFKSGGTSIATGTMGGAHDSGPLNKISLRFFQHSGNIQTGNFRVYGLKETI